MPVHRAKEGYHNQPLKLKAGATSPSAARPANVPAVSARTRSQCHSRGIGRRDASSSMRSSAWAGERAVGGSKGYRHGTYTRDLVTASGKAKHGKRSPEAVVPPRRK